MWNFLGKGQYIWCPLVSFFVSHCPAAALSYFIVMIAPSCSHGLEPQRFPWWQGHLAGAQCLLRCFWWSADCGLEQKKFCFCLGDWFHRETTRKSLIWGCLPVSYEGFRVAVRLTSLGRIYPWWKEEKNMEPVWPTTNAGIIWMNSVWAALKQFSSFNWVLNVFSLPFCLVWNLAVRGCSLPLNPVCSVRALCVCLAVWLRVAVLVWECQRLSVCHAVRRRSSVCNVRSRKSSLTLV